MRVPVSAVADITKLLEARKLPQAVALAPLAAMQVRAEFSRLQASNNPVALPLVGPRVAAGFPSPADDYIEDFLSLDDMLITEKESTFMVRVKGESMKEAGIFPGDLLLVDRSRDARNGDIVIAVLDGELTVKELRMRGGRVALVPRNPKFRPIILQEGQELLVWGIVTHSIHSFNRN